VLFTAPHAPRSRDAAQGGQLDAGRRQRFVAVLVVRWSLLIARAQYTRPGSLSTAKVDGVCCGDGATARQDAPIRAQDAPGRVLGA